VSEPDSKADTPAAPEALRRTTQAIYLLHALSLLIGALSSAFIVTAFVFGLPSLIAVLLNYLRRGDAAGTWLGPHFRWQIRTFWFSLLWLCAATLLFGPLVFVLVGGPLLVLAYVATGLWAAYRVIRGWLALRDGQPPAPGYPAR
jgi:uncharacterized membrane protein